MGPGPYAGEEGRALTAVVPEVVPDGAAGEDQVAEHPDVQQAGGAAGLQQAGQRVEAVLPPEVALLERPALPDSQVAVGQPGGRGGAVVGLQEQPARVVDQRCVWSPSGQVSLGAIKSNRLCVVTKRTGQSRRYQVKQAVCGHQADRSV